MTREEIIKELSIEYLGDSERMIKAKKMAIKALEQEPRKGHWIKVTGKIGHLVCECDKCGWQQKLYTNFCPCCSADMREIEE